MNLNINNHFLIHSTLPWQEKSPETLDPEYYRECEQNNTDPEQSKYIVNNVPVSFKKFCLESRDPQYYRKCHEHNPPPEDWSKRHLIYIPQVDSQLDRFLYFNFYDYLRETPLNPQTIACVGGECEVHAEKEPRLRILSSDSDAMKLAKKVRSLSHKCLCQQDYYLKHPQEVDTSKIQEELDYLDSIYSDKDEALKSVLQCPITPAHSEYISRQRDVRDEQIRYNLDVAPTLLCHASDNSEAEYQNEEYWQSYKIHEKFQQHLNDIWEGKAHFNKFDIPYLDTYYNQFRHKVSDISRGSYNLLTKNKVSREFSSLKDCVLAHPLRFLSLGAVGASVFFCPNQISCVSRLA